MAADLPVRLSPARLAAIRTRAERAPGTPEGRALRDLLAELDRLRPWSAANPLTPAEMPVVIGLALGETVNETAARTGHSPHTVRSHRRRVGKRLGAVCGAQIVAIAFANKWIHATDIATTEGDQ